MSDVDDQPDGAPARAGAVTPLDANALAKLRELDPDGELNVVVRVLDVYRSTLLQALQELATLQAVGQAAQHAGQRTAQPTPQQQDSSAAELMRIAHKLKSSSASVGALALSRACNKVEQDVRSGTPFELRPATQRLLDEGHAALAAVEAMLQN